MKIPKSFNMMNRKIKVKITDEDKFLIEGENLGYSKRSGEKNEYTIVLSELNADNTEILIHEFLHHLFYVVCEYELAGNEKLIDLMAQVTTQAINSAKWRKN